MASRRATWSIVTLASILFLFMLPGLASVGAADNGDFLTRGAAFTDGPVDLPAWPDAARTQIHSRRFFDYFVPDWRLRVEMRRPHSSTALLWHALAAATPGSVADLGWWGQALRVLTFVLGMGLVVELAQHVGVGWIGTGTVAALVLFTTVDLEITGYFASFYESAGFPVYLFALLWAAARVRRDTAGLAPPVLTLALSCVIGTVQTGTFPFALVGATYATHALLRRRATGARVRWFAALATGTAIAAACLFLTTRQGHGRVHPFHSLFAGALTFSERPEEHLERMGFAEADAALVGHSAFEPSGLRYIDSPEAEQRLGFSQTIAVYTREPLAALRAAGHVVDALHERVTLGRFEFPTRTAHSASPDWRSPFTLCCHTLVPHGPWFWLWLPVVLLVHGAAWRRGAALSGIALALLLTGCLTAALAVLGDGRHELARHLHYSRVCLGSAAILLVASGWHLLCRLLRSGDPSQCVAAP